ncbi:hypothetical protein Q9Q94_09390 [Uliginosibacterium sp. 31-16]|uniref:hypothetical protein n=1 Tax=Uliginosibacterium sp. 31-16 TaxID=3068315 RepID=UPI00273FDFBD|nr:hypothetical protein [Uliginosibacterium sp. 31-16]MDP5239744.1 hypothetical protein [Uliginosibacterium sp. 31-16]
MAFICGLKSLIVIALIAITPFAWGANEDPAVLDARLRLADAFAAKDKEAVHALISDPLSGFRFYESQADEWWVAAGRAIREARLISEDEAENISRSLMPHDRDRVIYSILWHGQIRPIAFVLRRSVWALDLNSFLGPFPTGLR